MERNEPVALSRPVEATQIPSGFKVVLPEGAWVTVQQVLGGNLTAMTDRGGLVRIVREEPGRAIPAPRPRRSSGGPLHSRGVVTVSGRPPTCARPARRRRRRGGARRSRRNRAGAPRYVPLPARGS